jgi:hypothetical protein
MPTKALLYAAEVKHLQLLLRSTTVMKIAVKTLVLGMCVAGATAAFATSHVGTVPMVASHQAVMGAAPIPSCSPGTRCTGNGFLSAAPIPSCSPGTRCTGNGFLAAAPIPSCSPGTRCTGNGFLAAAPIPSCSPGTRCTGTGHTI